MNTLYAFSFLKFKNYNPTEIGGVGGKGEGKKDKHFGTRTRVFSSNFAPRLTRI